MSTNTQGGYRIGTVKGRNPSEDRAMSYSIDEARLAAALETVGRWQGRVTSKDVWLDEARSVAREYALLSAEDKAEAPR